MSSFLIIGECGVGKTWLMTKLLNESTYQSKKYRLIKFKLNDKGLAITGVYDKSIFQGSDRLAMNVSSDFEAFKKVCDLNKITPIFEGDRFMNKNLVRVFNPFIIKITGSGDQGRLQRGTNQSTRQLKSIKTRVSNIKANIEFKNSTDAFLFLKKELKGLL